MKNLLLKKALLIGVIFLTSITEGWGQNYVTLGTGTGNTGFANRNPFFNFAS